VIKRFPYFTAGAIVFGGFAVPAAIITWLDLRGAAALLLLAVCVFPTSACGLWIATAALHRARHEGR
jgi:hypothetical protein